MYGECVEARKNPSPLFLNSFDEITSYFSGRKRMFKTDFYKYQRQRLNILLDHNQKPLADKWTFDGENRLKYPNGKTPPKISFINPNRFQTEAIACMEKG